MCGIVGLAGFRNDALLQEMCSRLRHRGPDDDGSFLTDSVSLGMQRLAIIDLEDGQQPMTAERDRIAVVFNGEIYNHRELRRELTAAGYEFRTRCDTEAILHAFRHWGVSFVDKLNGMFAIAVLDRRNTPTLHLIRDRAGIKPLYYHHAGGRLCFASELKALLLNPEIERELNPRAAHWYLKLRFVPGPETLFRSILKLPPGHVLTWRSGDVQTKQYWTPPFPAEKLSISENEAVERVGEALEQSIRLRLQADVPVGAFLSGGLDSGVIAALVARQHGQSIKTFSIGFDYEGDETAQAAETARALGTEHHKVVCTDRDFEHLDSIAWHLDEPVGDAIVLCLYLLSMEARKHVKVVLSGEGADELFGGYLFHKALLLIRQYKKWLPRSARACGRAVFGAMPHQIVNLAFSYPAALGADGKRKIQRFLLDAEVDSLPRQFRSLITLFDDRELAAAYRPEFAARIEQQSDYVQDRPATGATPLDDILEAALPHWLPDVILMKLDKMTMAHSLEGRVPFLDHELIQLVNSLPDRLKIRRWTDKWVLRKLAERHLPRTTAWRKKKPFFIPTHTYFQKPTFRALFEDFRERNHLGPLFRPSFLEGLNLSQTSLIGSKQLFSLMMLNSWLRQYLKAPAHQNV